MSHDEPTAPYVYLGSSEINANHRLGEYSTMLTCECSPFTTQTCTLPKANSSPLKGYGPQKETIVFQPSIFRCKLAANVSWRLSTQHVSVWWIWSKSSSWGQYLRSHPHTLGILPKRPWNQQLPPPKFNSLPLKSSRAPTGKDRLPTIFQFRLRGCNVKDFVFFVFFLFRKSGYK